MDTRLLEKLKQYARLVHNYLPSGKVILFGSYARNEATPESDIDVAIIVDDTDENFLTVSAKLWELSWQVDTAIEPKLIRRKHTQSGIYETIMHEGVTIYE